MFRAELLRSAREAGSLVAHAEEESDDEPMLPAPRQAIRRSGPLACLAVFAIVALAVGSSFALPRASTQQRGGGGEVVLAGGATGSGEFPWGYTIEKVCGVDFHIQEVLHSNFGGQGPDHGEEGIVYRCSELDNGKYLRDVKVKINAKTPYHSKHAYKNGMLQDFGFIVVQSGDKVEARFSVWDMEDKPLTVRTFRISFYDLDQGPHGSSREFVIADDHHPDFTEQRHAQLQERHVHGDAEFMATHRGSSADNPKDSKELTEMQKERSVVFEYHNNHFFDATLGATDGHSPRSFVFALHSALACHKAKVAITTTVHTTTTAAPPEKGFNWWWLLLALLLLLPCCLLLLCCFLPASAPAPPPPPPPVVVKEAAPVVDEEQPIVEPPPPPPPAPAPVPVVAKPPPPYLMVAFLDAESQPVTKTWYDKPLGFTFLQDDTPVVVTKVVKGSKADLLGVKTGMKVTGIEFTGQDMTSVEDKDYAQTTALLAKGVDVLPHETDRPYVELTLFKPSTNELLVKTWYTKPLGIVFSPSAPIVVNKVDHGTRAWELGVEPGMHISSVAHTDVPDPVDVNEKSYDDVMKIMQTGMKRLSPQA